MTFQIPHQILMITCYIRLLIGGSICKLSQITNFDNLSIQDHKDLFFRIVIGSYIYLEINAICLTLSLNDYPHNTITIA